MRPPKSAPALPAPVAIISPEQLEHLVAKAVKEAIGGDLQVAPVEQPTGIPIAERILRLTETCLLVGLSRWAIADLERAGKFPQRVAITDTVFGYRGDEVLAWRDARPRTRPA